MKIYFLAALFFLGWSNLSPAQTVYGKAFGDASAVLELYSNNKGFLPPRTHLKSGKDMSTISNPVNGLTVFHEKDNSPISEGYYFYDDPRKAWLRVGDIEWDFKGNFQVDSLSHFLGTTDDADLVFKRNNKRAGLLNADKRNTSWGLGALETETSGTDNVALGYQSMLNNKEGSGNVAAGVQALFSNLSGKDNVAAGYQSLYKNINGSDNIGLGAFSLYNNTNGNSNVSLGYQALYNNTEGSKNVAVGYNALYENTKGEGNVAFGYEAMKKNYYGHRNVAMGRYSLASNIDGGSSTALGAGSLSLAQAEENTAVGVNSLANNISGLRNTAVGYKSLYNLKSGSNNTGYGSFAGINLTTGDFNTALGDSTIFMNPTGSYQLNIGNAIYGTNLDGTVFAPRGKIGIGTSSPNSTLQVAGSLSMKYTSLADGTVADDDFTVLILGAITLPNASAANSGRIYYLINGTVSEQSVHAGNYFLEKGSLFSDFRLSKNPGSKGITVQSNGSSWVIIDKF